MSGERLLIRAAERGRTSRAWLDARHSFSFGEFYHPERFGFAALRVLNEDRIAPGGGFPEHGHANMEILTVLLSGSLRHRDSLGHEEVLGPGDAQWMGAGHGIRHSEVNASAEAPVHLLQLWLQPERSNLPPGHALRRGRGGFPPGETLLAARAGEGVDALPLRLDARIAMLRLLPGEARVLASPGRRWHWLQLVEGASSEAEGEALEAGDGLGLASDAVCLSAGSAGALLLWVAMAMPAEGGRAIFAT